MAEHISGPDHWPGSLYGCPACEENCYCEHDASTQIEAIPCLHCELVAERERADGK
jgi:hypothetical protein